MGIETLMLVFTALAAIATALLAVFTWRLAKSTVKMADEAHNASVRQLGVQTWLQMVSRFDSPETKRARAKLAGQLENYHALKHDEISEEVLNLFEDIGTLYKFGLIDKELADSTFSYYATRWWELAKPYIIVERQKNKDEDEEIFADFEAFADAVRRPNEKMDRQKFVKDEKQLNSIF